MARSCGRAGFGAMGPGDQTRFARQLRRDMTLAEAMVWRALRGSRLSGEKFRRQVPVGPYVADFLCREAKVIVEIDGPSHDDPEQSLRDRDRDAWLEGQGFRILRFPNELALTGTEILVQKLRAVLRVGAEP